MIKGLRETSAGAHHQLFDFLYKKFEIWLLQDIMNSRDLDESGSLNFEEFLMAMPANLVNIPKDEHK